MGYICHHAIIVTTWNEKHARDIEARAREIFKGKDIAHLESVINGYRTIFIPPDGSKEGWVESDTGDGQRAQFIAWLKHEAIAVWVEVQYGDEAGESQILNDSADQPVEDE